MNFVQDNDVHNNKQGRHARTSLVIYSLGNKHFWHNIGNHRVAKSEPTSSSRAGEC